MKFSLCLLSCIVIFSCSVFSYEITVEGSQIRNVKRNDYYRWDIERQRTAIDETGYVFKFDNYRVEAGAKVGYDGRNCYQYHRGVIKFDPITMPSWACNIHAKLRVEVSVYPSNDHNYEKHYYGIKQLPNDFDINMTNAESFFNAILFSNSPVGSQVGGTIEDCETKEYDITNQVLGNHDLYFAAIEGDELAWVTSFDFHIIVTYDRPVNITIKNYPEGGNIKVGDNVTPSEKPSGYCLNTTSAGHQINLEAIQVTNQYPKRIWESNSYWKGRDNLTGAEFELSRTPSFTYATNESQSDLTFTANISLYNLVNFQNIIPGYNVPSEIKINGVSYNYPYPSLDIKSGQTITVEVPEQYEYENIIYHFKGWYSGDQYLSSSPQATLMPNKSELYTTKYVGFADKPINPTAANVALPNLPSRILLSWDEYPNNNVSTYRITRYRFETKGPNYFDDGVIATVPRGTTSYSDANYKINNTDGKWQLRYHILPYFSPDATYANATAANLVVATADYWGGEGGGVLDKKVLATKNRDVENRLMNYPNPFNPTTKINYSIKRSGFAIIQVFDILGNKIQDLVNEYKAAGEYFVEFDGNNLPSGFYLCTIKSGEYVETKKMLLMK